MEIESGKKQKEYKVLKKPEIIARELQQFILHMSSIHRHFFKKRHTLKVKETKSNYTWEVWFTPVNRYESYIIATVVYYKNRSSFVVYRPAFQHGLGWLLTDKYFKIIEHYFDTYPGYIPIPYLNIKKKGVSLWK